MTLGLLEAAFSLFYVESDGFRHTRASKRWYAEHWNPVNRWGVRDIEHDETTLASRRPVVVVGDSFAAGSGVEDYRDRFANQLGARLGAEYSTVLLAQPGWNTGQQSQALERFPVRPRVLVLSYYLNDIEDVARSHGRSFQVDLSVRPSWLGPVVEASSLANFVYWRLARSRLGSVGKGYGEFVYAAFRDPEVWRAHAVEIDSLVGPARRQGALVYAVVFPHLFDLEGSVDAVARVTEHFREADVPVVDVGELIRAGDWTPGELIVGPVDPHPSVALHAAVAEALYRLVAH